MPTKYVFSREGLANHRPLLAELTNFMASVRMDAGDRDLRFAELYLNGKLVYQAGADTVAVQQSLRTTFADQPSLLQLVTQGIAGNLVDVESSQALPTLTFDLQNDFEAKKTELMATDKLIRFADNQQAVISLQYDGSDQLHIGVSFHSGRFSVEDLAESETTTSEVEHAVLSHTIYHVRAIDENKFQLRLIKHEEQVQCELFSNTLGKDFYPPPSKSRSLLSRLNPLSRSTPETELATDARLPEDLNFVDSVAPVTTLASAAAHPNPLDEDHSANAASMSSSKRISPE